MKDELCATLVSSDVVMLFVFLLACFLLKVTSISEIYTLSLHDALPISTGWATSGTSSRCRPSSCCRSPATGWVARSTRDRKSTRLNSSHRCISYAVFCLKKKNKQIQINTTRQEHTNLSSGCPSGHHHVT